MQPNRARSVNVRVVLIRQAQAEPNSTVPADKLEDDAENVEPRCGFLVLELGPLLVSSDPQTILRTRLNYTDEPQSKTKPPNIEGKLPACTAISLARRRKPKNSLPPEVLCHSLSALLIGGLVVFLIVIGEQAQGPLLVDVGGSYGQGDGVN